MPQSIYVNFIDLTPELVQKSKRFPGFSLETPHLLPGSNWSVKSENRHHHPACLHCHLLPIPPWGTHIQLFPAISGRNIDVQVNFGDAQFLFGGPDPSYIAFCDVMYYTV